MDFILSLTHFCEIHGPKSVLCTRLLPIECTQCQQPDRHPSSSSSSTSLATQIHQVNNVSPSLHHRDTNPSLPGGFSGASTTVDSAPESPAIERHELFVSNDRRAGPPKKFNFSGARGDSCASCCLVIPEDLSRELPDGAPGSSRPDGRTRNEAPVLRSRKLICLGSGDHTGSLQMLHNLQESPSITLGHASGYSSSPRSYQSLFSSCHDHLLTYLSSRDPEDPAKFSALRASVIRTLSRELLPAGMSDGRFCFGDKTNGYTIAYVFRLPDPKARGRRRLYAFVALAGRDARRAFHACPLVWEAFSKLAKAIEAATVETQAERRRTDEEEQERERDKARNYTPVSSFLSHRAADPNGNPRKAGHIAARSLADMVGSDRIFSDVHTCFVSLLQELEDLYGVMSRPGSDVRAVCQATGKERNLSSDVGSTITTPNNNIRTEILKTSSDIDRARDRDTTSTLHPIDTATARKIANGNAAGSTVQQCAPIAVGQPVQPSLVV